MEMLDCYFLQVAGSKEQTIDIGSVKYRAFWGFRTMELIRKLRQHGEREKEKGDRRYPTGPIFMHL